MNEARSAARFDEKRHPGMNDTNARRRRISSAQIAEKMGVSLNTVYVYRSSDRDKTPGPARFPDPVGFDGRTVLFDESAIDAYIKARSDTHGRAGRPPRTAPRHTGPTAPFPDRIREAVTAGAGAPSITTLKQLADALQLSAVTFGERMRGHTTWTPEEREHIASVLGVDVSDANDQVDQIRAARRAQRKSGE